MDLDQLEKDDLEQFESMASPFSSSSRLPPYAEPPSRNIDKDPMRPYNNTPLSLNLPSMSLFSTGDFFSEFAESVANLGVHESSNEDNRKIHTIPRKEIPIDSSKIEPPLTTKDERPSIPCPPEKSSSARSLYNTIDETSPSDQTKEVIDSQDRTSFLDRSSPPEPNLTEKRTQQRRVPLSPRRRYFSPVLEDPEEEEEEYYNSRHLNQIRKKVTISPSVNTNSQHWEPASLKIHAPILPTVTERNTKPESIKSNDNSDKSSDQGSDDSSVNSERVTYCNMDRSIVPKSPRPPSTVSMNSKKSLKKSASSIDQNFSKKRSVRFFDWMTSKMKPGSSGSGIGKLSLLESRLDEPTTDKRETYAELIRELRREQTNLSIWTKKHLNAPPNQERYRGSNAPPTLNGVASLIRNTGYQSQCVRRKTLCL